MAEIHSVGEFDLDAFIQGRDSIAGARPSVDPMADVVRIEPLGIPERPYMGLRDVFGGRGDVPHVIAALKECDRVNAWPDWRGFFTTSEKMGWDIGRSVAVISEAIAAANWEQTVGDVMQEVINRGQDSFVVQSPRGRMTIDSGLELVSP